MGLFKKTNTTLHYRVPTTPSASVKGISGIFPLYYWCFQFITTPQSKLANQYFSDSISHGKQSSPPPKNKRFKQKEFSYVKANVEEKITFSHKEK